MKGEIKVENIERMKAEIHENAVAHGWWEESRSFGEICALIHSELSEALEEYRDGKPDVYIVGEHGITPITPGEWEGEKPEGVAVELADAVIRILDYMGEAGIAYMEEANDLFRAQPTENSRFGNFLALCHSDVADAFMRSKSLSYYDSTAGVAAALSVCIRRIEVWCEAKGLDLAQIMAIKHQYNKGRPYRHGGKRI